MPGEQAMARQPTMSRVIASQARTAARPCPRHGGSSVTRSITSSAEPMYSSRSLASSVKEPVSGSRRTWAVSYSSTPPPWPSRHSGRGRDAPGRRSSTRRRHPPPCTTGSPPRRSRYSAPGPDRRDGYAAGAARPRSTSLACPPARCPGVHRRRRGADAARRGLRAARRRARSLRKAIVAWSLHG